MSTTTDPSTADPADVTTPPDEPDGLRSIHVAGRRVRVAVRPGTGTPLVLCNGIGAGLEVLRPLVDALHPDRCVIRFDVPGIGGSPLPPRPAWMPELALLLGRLLRRLGHREADVLGISWGGGLAQQFAALHPRRCRRLVLVATGTGAVMVPARPRVLWRMSSPRRYRDPHYLTRVAGEIYGGTARDDPAGVAARMHSDSRVASPLGYAYQLLAGWGWTSLPQLPLIRQPTLLLAGDDDPIIPLVNARIMGSLLPHATTHIYRGGHLALVTEAETLAPVIDGFLGTPG